MSADEMVQARKLDGELVECDSCGCIAKVRDCWTTTKSFGFFCNRCAVRAYPGVTCICCEGTGEIFNAGVYIKCPDCEMTLVEVQAELKRIKRGAKKRGLVTRNQAFKGE